MLKKIVALCLAAGFILYVWLLPSIILAFAPEIKVVTPQVEEYLPQVYCSGIVHAKAAYDLVSSGFYRVEEVYCRAGQQVKEGQALALLAAVAAECPFFLRHSQEVTPEVPQQLAVLAGQYGITPEDIMAFTAGSNGAVQTFLEENDAPLMVRAPLEGVLTGDFPDPGTTVAQGTVLCRVQSLSYMVTANLSEGDVERVAVGDLATITGEGIGDSLCQGVIERISPTAKQVFVGITPQSVVEAEIRIHTAPQELRSGYRVGVAIDIQGKRHLLTLPYEAIGQDESNQEYVYIAIHNGFRKRPVTTGLEMKEGVEIVEGIAPDEIVAVFGGVEEPEEKKMYRMKGG